MSDSSRSRDGSNGPEDGDARGGVVRNEDDEGWRFELTDPDDESEVPEERPPLEPGSPSAENVFFVLVGVALTLLLFLSVFVPLPFVA